MKLGDIVYYTARNTRGPRAAMVISVLDQEKGELHLQVFNPNGGAFPAFNVTPEPTTKVEHYWSPREEE